MSSPAQEARPNLMERMLAYFGSAPMEWFHADCRVLNKKTNDLFHWLRWFGFARVLVFGEAEVAHRRVVVRKGDSISFELGIFELLPQVELFFHARFAFRLRSKARGGPPSVRGRTLGAGP